MLFINGARVVAIFFMFTGSKFNLFFHQNIRWQTSVSACSEYNVIELSFKWIVMVQSLTAFDFIYVNFFSINKMSKNK